MTDEQIIEAMARAMFKDDQINRLDIAKAMLAIARPIIERETRERCARIAEMNGDASGLYVAAAIRETGDE